MIKRCITVGGLLVGCLDEAIEKMKFTRESLSDESDAEYEVCPSFSFHAPSECDSAISSEEYPIEESEEETTSRLLVPMELPLDIPLCRLAWDIPRKASSPTKKLQDDGASGAYLHKLISLDEDYLRNICRINDIRKRSMQHMMEEENEEFNKLAMQRKTLLNSLRTDQKNQAAVFAKRIEEIERDASKVDAEKYQARTMQKGLGSGADQEKESIGTDTLQKEDGATTVPEVHEKTSAKLEMSKDLTSKPLPSEAVPQSEEKEKVSTDKKVLETLSSNSDAILSVSSSAAEEYQSRKESFVVVMENIRPFAEDRGMRDIKRSIDKFVTLNVQQISATLDQINAKSRALVSFLHKFTGIQQDYALFALSKKFVSQCEVQITRLHSFAFPLAEVAVAVGNAFPKFVELLIARLQENNPLNVPMYWGYRKGGNELSYLRLLGYKVTDESNVESTDEFISRMQGYIMFYAAFTQSDNSNNNHGLEFAWKYLARLLNSVPPTRVTAAALDSFLKVTGYRLAQTYNVQFMKLIKCIEEDFLRELERQDDPDSKAVYTRLQTYLTSKAFMNAPEGRNIPQHDLSSYDRA